MADPTPDVIAAVATASLALLVSKGAATALARRSTPPRPADGSCRARSIESYPCDLEHPHHDSRHLNRGHAIAWGAAHLTGRTTR